MSILFSTRKAFLAQNLSKCFQLKSFHGKRKFATATQQNTKEITAESVTPKIPTLQQVLKCRRDEANRSILVQVQSAASHQELHAYCNSVGTVKEMFHYTTNPEPLHFIIVEFASENDVRNIYNSSSYLEDSQVVPVHSSFLWFRASQTKKLKVSKNFTLSSKNATHSPSDGQVLDTMRQAEDLSDQMIKLHEMTKLNDVGTRLRFLVAKQIEMAVSGMFPSATALPFGSSVNGCGRMGCDLDLVLRLNENFKERSDDARLIYHSKASSSSERVVSQRHMEAIGDIIQLFLPGCSQVRRILQARVPIIKFHQQFADVECDLSMSNLSGVYMSDFLYLMGSIDDRVRPLVFAVRKWAADVGLTNSSPGRWITNFSLTLMVLSFLQNNAILPTLNTLIKAAGPEDKFVTDEGVNCTFLKDPNKYISMRPAENTEPLKTLLQQFFEHYSQFDFGSKAICLNEAVALTKPEHSALYIVNPLERGLNVSKNVSFEELEKFRSEVRNAAWILGSDEVNNSNWGLLSLIKRKKGANGNSSYNRHSKLLQVSKLFEKEEVEVEFKNSSVAKQVSNIKRLTKEELKKIENGMDIERQKSGR